MSDCKIYLLDSRGRIAFAYDFGGASDEAALKEGKQYAAGSPVEVWQRTRLVGRIAMDGTSATG